MIDYVTIVGFCVLCMRIVYCMLFEVVTIDLHYMTDRQECFETKSPKVR